MPVIKGLMDDLEAIGKIHKLKNDDYATDDNPYFNFDVQELIMSLFKNPRDKVFACLVGLKLSRLASTMNQSGPPNNESINDTFIDLSTYTLLWKNDPARSIKKPVVESELEARINRLNTK